MPRSVKVVLLCVAALVFIAMGVLWFGPLRLGRVQKQVHAAQIRTLATRVVATQGPSPAANEAVAQKPTPTARPVSTQRPTPTASPTATQTPSLREAQAQGPYTVKGNLILGADGQPYLFHGVGRDGLEYSCWGDGHFDAQELAYMGSGTNRPGITFWGANTVRLPLSEGIWLNGKSAQSCSATQYRTLIKQTVDTLTALKLNVIIDLQWSDAGGQSLQGGGPWSMPDADSITFWQQVASVYKSYPNVLFELFNEPHPHDSSCWAGPCTVTDTAYSDDCQCVRTLTFASVGMQAVVNTVRNVGATNLALVAGVDWGFNLGVITQYPIKGSNVVYDTHPYPYGEKLPPSWDGAFGNISKTYPVMSAESGEYDCGTSYMSQLLSYFDAHHIGWLAWAWVVQGAACSYPQLIQDYHGTPVPGMGQLVYTRLRSYV